MNTHINSVLDRVIADEQLKENTVKYLRKALIENMTGKIINIERRSFLSTSKMLLVACTMIVVFVGSIASYAVYKTPVSYLSLDINPSVELSVNVFNRVIAAEAYGEDGKIVLKDCKLDNLTVKDAVEEFVTSASENGFIANDGSSVISITAETDNPKLATTLETEAVNGANEAVSLNKKIVTVYKDSVALDRRDEAKKLSITPGKLNLIQKLQALDPKITIEQYRNSKVSTIMNKIKELKKVVIKKKTEANISSSTNKKGKSNQNTNISKPTEKAKDKSNTKSDVVTPKPTKAGAPVDNSKDNKIKNKTTGTAKVKADKTPKPTPMKLATHTPKPTPIKIIEPTLTPMPTNSPKPTQTPQSSEKKNKGN